MRAGLFAPDIAYQVLARWFGTFPKSIQYIGVFLYSLFLYSLISQEPPQVEPGTGVVRTGDDDVRQRDVFIPFFGYDRIRPGIPWPPTRNRKNG